MTKASSDENAQVNYSSKTNMKTTSKIIAFAIIACGMLAFTFTEPEPITVESIRNSFLFPLFDGDGTEDSSLFIMNKDEYDGNIYKGYAASRCNWGSSFVAKSLMRGLDTARNGFGPEVISRFKTLFGADIFKTPVKLAGKYDDGTPVLWQQYNSLAIQAAFDKLYQKPSEGFQGTALQKIYDISLKQYVRETTNLIITVQSKRTTFDALAKKYMLKATTDPDFSGLTFAWEATQKLKLDGEFSCLYGASDTIGTMLRRQSDGSLPILIACLKTVLKDYDNEYYTMVGMKF
jgi:hypothetical protein